MLVNRRTLDALFFVSHQHGGLDEGVVYYVTTFVYNWLDMIPAEHALFIFILLSNSISYFHILDAVYELNPAMLVSRLHLSFFHVPFCRPYSHFPLATVRISIALCVANHASRDSDGYYRVVF